MQICIPTLLSQTNILGKHKLKKYFAIAFETSISETHKKLIRKLLIPTHSTHSKSSIKIPSTTHCHHISMRLPVSLKIIQIDFNEINCLDDEHLPNLLVTDHKHLKLIDIVHTILFLVFSKYYKINIKK